MSQPIRGQGGHLIFPISMKNTTLIEDVEILLPVNFFVEFHSAVSEEKSKMSQPIRGQGGHFVFQIDSKNTNLVEGVEILLSVKFHWIPFSGFRGEVKNVKVYAGRTDDRRRTDRRTDGRRTVRYDNIAHSSLRLRWAKKCYFLQYFYIRSLLSGVNNNPFNNVMVQLSRNFIVDLKVLSHLYLTSMFIKTSTVELNLWFNFLFGAFSFVATYMYQVSSLTHTVTWGDMTLQFASADTLKTTSFILAMDGFLCKEHQWYISISEKLNTNIQFHCPRH